MAKPAAGRFRFVNLDGSEPHALSAVLKWALVDRVLGRRKIDTQPATTPRITPNLEELARPPAVGEPARLTWIGHASWLVQLDGVSLLIDPIFSDSIGPGIRRHVPPALDIPSLPHIDAQLVTHNHRDHLDVPSLTGSGRPVIAGTGLGAFFERVGLPCTELGWWEETRVGAVTIRFVPSQHWSRRGLSDTNETLWGGFVIEGSKARLYHSGDTAYFDGFSEIARRSGPIDAALLPIGAYEPAWFMSKQQHEPRRSHASLRRPGRAPLRRHAPRYVQAHYEALGEPPRRLAAEWQRRKLDVSSCHVLPIGGTLQLGSKVS